MKNKLKFIIPRLIGLTLAVGILSFLLITIFKILALITFSLALVAFIASRMRKKRMRRGSFDSSNYSRQAITLDNTTPMGREPISSFVKRPQVAIIPIH